MNWDVRHQVRVVLKEDKYVVHVFECDDAGRPVGVSRYYTDETLPDEIKAKLGMALFGMTGNGIGEVVNGMGAALRPLRWVDFWVGTKTYKLIRGETKRDTRSKSKSASAQDPQ